MLLSQETRKKIDHWLTKYPENQKRSTVVAALRLAQEQNHGHLSEALMQEVAAYLALSPIEVYEVASFYDMYEMKPIGKHKINVCTNVSCMLRGVDKITKRLEEKLGITYGETTKDGAFTLRESECLGACANAPVCMIDNKRYVEDLTVEKMDRLLEELK